jgi:hypothetical protein
VLIPVSQLHVILLQRAAETLGGAEELARYLAVPPLRVRVWLRGLIAPPDDVFLRLIDLLRPELPTDPPRASPHARKPDGGL